MGVHATGSILRGNAMRSVACRPRANRWAREHAASGRGSGRSSVSRPCRGRRRGPVAAAAQPSKDAPLVVVGSANCDLVLSLDRVPDAGETLAARSLETHPGGKGANQAAAAACLGQRTCFVGQVGDDSSGTYMRHELAARGVDLAALRSVPGVPTGTAVIMLDQTGENRIIIVGGANTHLPWDHLPQREGAGSAGALIAGAGALLLQREVPGTEVNVAAAQAARAAGVHVVLDCGGQEGPLEDGLLEACDTISPNETELARMTGLPTATDAEVLAAAESMLSDGKRQVLVKLGSKGSVLVRSGEEPIRQPAIPAPEVVDTTGAGDCFTAAFAVAFLEGKAPAECMRFAAAAASLCVRRMGAMSSMPSRAEVEALLREG
ncbi:unnamed protein product [Pedinophyceae sp. YPF-701]|nr:unnamed protein product [Pedinophyceae sp. YPF-701]